jgi:hypothetical protein
LADSLFMTSPYMAGGGNFILHYNFNVKEVKAETSKFKHAYDVNTKYVTGELMQNDKELVYKA